MPVKISLTIISVKTVKSSPCDHILTFFMFTYFHSVKVYIPGLLEFLWKLKKVENNVCKTQKVEFRK